MCVLLDNHRHWYTTHDSFHSLSPHHLVSRQISFELPTLEIDIRDHDEYSEDHDRTVTQYAAEVYADSCIIHKDVDRGTSDEYFGNVEYFLKDLETLLDSQLE